MILPIKSQLRHILLSFLQKGLTGLKKTDSKLSTVDLGSLPEINLEFGIETVQSVLSVSPRIERRFVKIQFQLSIQQANNPLYNIQDTVDYWVDKTQVLLNHGVLIKADGELYPYTLAFDSTETQLIDEANKPTAVAIINYDLTYQWQAIYQDQQLDDLLRVHVDMFEIITEIGLNTDA